MTEHHHHLPDLELEPELDQELVQEESLTSGIFTAAEECMKDGGEEAVRFVAASKDVDLYRTMIDFLFCELVNEGTSALTWRGRCNNFYLTGRKDIRAFLSQEQIRYCDHMLVVAIDLAKEIQKEGKQPRSWVKFCRLVRDKFDETPEKL